MTASRVLSPTEGFAAAADIRLVGIDDLSTVRYIHATAMRAHAGSAMSEDEVAAYRAMIYTQSYCENLLRQQLNGAWIDTEMVGTAGWAVNDDAGSTARIQSMFVNPLFGGVGLGTRLLLVAEQSARQAGFDTFSVRATPNSVGFFERNGYVVTSHGVRTIGPNVALPVAFMRKDGGAAQRPPQRPAPRGH
jgi:GNAT superfamily N-acetyltransferase